MSGLLQSDISDKYLWAYCRGVSPWSGAGRRGVGFSTPLTRPAQRPPVSTPAPPGHRTLSRQGPTLPCPPRSGRPLSPPSFLITAPIYTTTSVSRCRSQPLRGAPALARTLYRGPHFTTFDAEFKRLSSVQTWRKHHLSVAPDPPVPCPLHRSSADWCWQARSTGAACCPALP